MIDFQLGVKQLGAYYLEYVSKNVLDIKTLIGTFTSEILKYKYYMNAKIINLPKFLDKRGNLSFAEEFKQISFQIKRSYWIYDVPGGEARGGHAYKENEEFIIALSGSFDVLLDDTEEKRIFSLNRSYYGLYVPKGIWREMTNFSTNSLALILASTPFNKDDYMFEYEVFNKYAHGEK